ncbi:MAG: tetratricopeptide repeat protein [Candidatus Ratteibacteria bacterium]
MKKTDTGFLKRKKFYEKLIKIKPDFVEVLFQLSHIYILLKDYKKVLKIDKKIGQILNLDPISYYNLACDYSLLGDVEKAEKNLKIAISLGFNKKKYIKKDKDLDLLRKSKNFKGIEKLIK